MLARIAQVGLSATTLMWLQHNYGPVDTLALRSPLARVLEDTFEQSDPDREEPVEWIVVERPPERAPVPMLVPAELQNHAATQSQQGVLVMYQWVIGGEPVTSVGEPPYLWPSPQAIVGNEVVIDLGTNVAPIEVETRLFRSIDERGLPQAPSPAVWCRYLSASAACKLIWSNDTETWKVVIELPDQGTFFVSLRGVWGIPIDPSADEETEFSDVTAGWLFSVTTD